jgi:hypothetical protein
LLGFSINRKLQVKHIPVKMPFSRSSFLAALLLLSSLVLAQNSLPQVDLGYEIHKAISFNVSATATGKEILR